MEWILLAAVAGLCTGSFGLPLKFTSKWKWEHSWSMFAFWGLLVAPWVIAIVAVPNLFQIYDSVSWSVLCLVCLFGSCWGVGQITFGLGLAYLGIALGYSLMIGLIIVVGSVLPLVTNSAVDLFAPKSLGIIAGVTVIILSVVINAFAAVSKQKDLSSGTAQGDVAEKKSFIKGVIICLITGIAAPGLNYAFMYGSPLTAAASDLGAANTVAANAVLPIALLGAGLLNLGYCIWLLQRSNTWRIYLEKGTGLYYLFTPSMAIWTVGVALFGVAAANLGDTGPSIGWAVINATAIFWANLLGIFTAEWKGVSRKTWTIMIVGMVILLSGICIVGWANSLQ
jgi:L-rhamnose-H+ transport protein